MEAYKTTCSDCGHIRHWVGYKTGLGKSAEQLKQMEKDMGTCEKCGSDNVKTGLDDESEAGEMLSAQGQLLAKAFEQVFSKKR